ncbi:MAG: hypothetical protein ACXW0Z_19115 [Gemmatirosa sp.]
MTETAPGGEQWDRRAFLRAAVALAAGAAAAGCDAPGTAGGAPAVAPGAPPGARRARDVALDRATLAAVGEVVLPGELGVAGRAGAVDAFVAWVAGYAPVAERMHGYGYADVRYLPPDPAPGWGAQLDGLELLARRSRGASFAALPIADRRALVESALASTPGDRLPAPIAAGHVALALLSHWASSPAAWDLAYGARITPATCRPLAEAPRRPLPLASAPTTRA